MKVLIVGYPGGEHVGSFWTKAAAAFGWIVELADIRNAAAPPTLFERVRYRLADKRPANLVGFSRSVVDAARQGKPDFLIATGCAPLLAEDLRQIGRLGVKSANFTTDDPWARAHRANWFLEALPAYDLVLSPRRSTFDDFKALGVRRVEYLPFAYDPAVHRRTDADPAATRRFACDVLFYGGADRDRVAAFRSFIGSGLDFAVYGSYWQRHGEFRPYFRGVLDPLDIAPAIAAARVTVCLGRKANRDSHAMRSYEAPAMGACLIAENTRDHRELYGNDGAVEYFDRPEDMPALARALVADPARITAMRDKVHERIVRGPNTYADRLRQVVELLR